MVKLLLEKGAQIDKLDNFDRNCLDIAIEYEHTEVIKVLISNENWQKLITWEYNDNGQVDEVLNDYTKKQENLQLVNLFHTKNWTVFEMILDKCTVNLKTTNQWDFSILDRPVRSKVNHPLMLVARSGEEKLIKHVATLNLLNLKWRFIPRFVFYFNLMIVIVFLGKYMN